MIVKHSSWPATQDLYRLMSTFAMIDAIGDELGRSTTKPPARSWFRPLC